MLRAVFDALLDRVRPDVDPYLRYFSLLAYDGNASLLDSDAR